MTRSIFTVSDPRRCLGLALLTSVMTLAGACSDETPSTGPAAGPLDVAAHSTLEPTTCPVTLPGLEQTCSTLTVPAHWDDPDDGEVVTLQLAILRTAQTPADAVPTVFLPGGPGGDIFGDIAGAPEYVAALASQRPFIFFTPRGTIGSTPSLECDDIVADTELLASEACILELRAQGVDLSPYSSRASVHDVEAMRAHLGYARWNLLGESYGTVLAQLVMDAYPDGIDTVVLSSVAQLAPTSFYAFPDNVRQQVEAYFDACEASEDCNTRYPQLRERFDTLLEQLRTDPLSLPLPAGDYVPLPDGTLVDYLTLDDTWLSYVAAGELALAPETIGFLPKLVEELERGETTTATEIPPSDIYPEPTDPTQRVFPDAVAGPFDAGGLVVLCNDTFGGVQPSDFEFDETSPIEVAVHTLPGYTFEEWAAPCDAVDGDGHDTLPTAPIQSDIPTLLLTGQFDDATPAYYAEEAGRSLTNGTVVIVDSLGHGVLFTGCGAEIALNFFDDSSTASQELCFEDTRITWQ